MGQVEGRRAVKRKSWKRHWYHLQPEPCIVTTVAMPMHSYMSLTLPCRSNHEVLDLDPGHGNGCASSCRS